MHPEATRITTHRARPIICIRSSVTPVGPLDRSHARQGVDRHFAVTRHGLAKDFRDSFATPWLASRFQTYFYTNSEQLPQNRRTNRCGLPSTKSGNPLMETASPLTKCEIQRWRSRFPINGEAKCADFSIDFAVPFDRIYNPFPIDEKGNEAIEIAISVDENSKCNLIEMAFLSAERLSPSRHFPFSSTKIRFPSTHFVFPSMCKSANPLNQNASPSPKIQR